MSNKKLLQEVDRNHKKIQEGLEEVNILWSKFESADNTSIKDKIEAELKKEIKKLQRLRDDIRRWLGSSEIKSKTTLNADRKSIEDQMQKFKSLEKSSKLKMFSNHGLLKQSINTISAKPENLPSLEWLTEQIQAFENCISELETQIEEFGDELDNNGPDETLQAQLESAKDKITLYQFHSDGCQKAYELLFNDTIVWEQIEEIKDGILYFLESVVVEDEIDDDFLHDELLYEVLDETPKQVEQRRISRLESQPDRQKAYLAQQLQSQMILAQQQQQQAFLAQANNSSTTSFEPESSFNSTSGPEEVAGCSNNTSGVGSGTNIKAFNNNNNNNNTQSGNQSTSNVSTTSQSASGTVGVVVQPLGTQIAGINNNNNTATTRSTTPTTTNDNADGGHSSISAIGMNGVGSGPISNQATQNQPSQVQNQALNQQSSTSQQQLTTQQQQQLTSQQSNQATPAGGVSSTQPGLQSGPNNTQSGPSSTQSSQNGPNSTQNGALHLKNAQYTSTLTSPQSQLALSTTTQWLTQVGPAISAAQPLVGLQQGYPSQSYPLNIVPNQNSSSYQFWLSTPHPYRMGPPSWVPLYPLSESLQGGTQSYNCSKLFKVGQSAFLSPQGNGPQNLNSNSGNSTQSNTSSNITPKSCSIYSKLSDETLRYICFNQEGSGQHYHAAQQLKQRGWRFHVGLSTWVFRVTSPDLPLDAAETAIYIVADRTTNQLYRGHFAFSFAQMENEVPVAR